MIFDVIALSTYALHVIQNEEKATVHSVYRNTINVTINDSLLAIQTKNSPVSPISLITNLSPEDFTLLSLAPVQILILKYDKAKIYNLAPKNEIQHVIQNT